MSIIAPDAIKQTNFLNSVNNSISVLINVTLNDVFLEIKSSNNIVNRIGEITKINR
jgi:hypothetical protein